jgi:hypothetical protein
MAAWLYSAADLSVLDTLILFAKGFAVQLLSLSRLVLASSVL